MRSEIQSTVLALMAFATRSAGRLASVLARERAGYCVLALCFVAVAGAVIFVRTALAFEFPIPWPDEAINLSQAFAFARTGSFMVPALNPDRVLMWMPMGYIATMAAIFKVIGYSFDTGRWISAFFYIGSYFFCLLVIRRLLVGWRLVGAALFSALVFVLPLVIVSANIARMESLYVFLFFASLLFSVNGLWVFGLSTVLVAACVHFNAVYFLLPYGVYILRHVMQRRLPTVELRDLAALAVAGLAVATYAAFCLSNLDGFLADMAFQFARKSSRSFDGLEGRVAMLGFLLCVPIAQLVIKRAFTPSVFVSLYGISFFLMALYGREMWYLLGYPLGVLLVILALAADLPSTASRWQHLGSVVLVAVLALCVQHYGYSTYLLVDPLRVQVTERVISRTDREHVSTFIRALRPGTTVAFAFNFSGIEPFFLEDFAHSGAVWSMQAHSVTQSLPLRAVDYRIRCDSHLFKPLIAMSSDGDFPRRGLDTGCEIFKLKE